MSRRRRRGSGSIVCIRGKYLPRLPACYQRKALTACDSYEDAEQLLDSTIAKLQQQGKLPTSDIGETWQTMAHKWLRRHKRGTLKAYGVAIARVSKASWTSLPIAAVTRRHLLDWLDDRERTRSHSRNTTELDLAAVHQVFRLALDREVIVHDPTIRVSMPKHWETPDDAWTYLTRDELVRLLEDDQIPLADRAILAFLVGTGLRKAEWESLREEDVHADVVVVRFGSEVDGRTGPTKGKKIRAVPILPITARAWRLWREHRTVRRNPLGLAFPGANGGLNRWWWKSGFRTIVDRLGRPFRPHDTRHTAAAALVSGYYQHRWTLRAVQRFLGHGSITVTEKYAHLSEEAVDLAVLETRDLSGTHSLLSGSPPQRNPLIEAEFATPEQMSNLSGDPIQAMEIADDSREVLPDPSGSIELAGQAYLVLEALARRGRAV